MENYVGSVFIFLSFQVLQILPTASAEEIKKTYRKVVTDICCSDVQITNHTIHTHHSTYTPHTPIYHTLFTTHTCHNTPHTTLHTAHYTLTTLHTTPHHTTPHHTTLHYTILHYTTLHTNLTLLFVVFFLSPSCLF